jgi:transketolase
MRTSFFQALGPLFSKDRRIVVITADLGFKLFDPFKEVDSERFYNMGVAEANMIGVAAGLSLCGKKVYCYSISPFLVMRPFEQIRIDVAYHNLDVKLVAVGGGLAYGLEGITHHGLEDIALMRTLPNMVVIIPADPMEAACFAKLSYTHPGPMYIRLCHTNEPSIHPAEPELEMGKALIVEEGHDIALFATGRMVYTAIQASEILRKNGISASVVNVHTIKPLDIELIERYCEMHEAIFTVEEHGLEGGLGSAVAEVVAESGNQVVFKRFGVDRTRSYVGRADYLREKHGLSPEAIAGNVEATLRGMR